MEEIMSAINVLSQEEKFIHVVDKFITHNHSSVNNNAFYKKKTLYSFRRVSSEVFLFTGGVPQFMLSRR